MTRNKLLLIIFSLFFFLFINIKVEALVKPTSEFYVNDYANILSTDTEKYIMNNSVKLASSSGIQIVVVTVKNLEGQDIETYATDLYRQFGIGNNKDNKGLLILLSLEERDIKIEVGYGLEEVITDGLAGRYLDEYFVPLLKDDRWDEGIKNGYSALYQKICDYYDINYDNINAQRFDYSDDSNPIDNAFFISAITGIIYGIFSQEKKDEPIKKAKKKKVYKPKTKKENKSPIIPRTILGIGNVLILYALIKNYSLKGVISNIPFCLIVEYVSLTLTRVVKILLKLSTYPSGSGGSRGGSSGGFSSYDLGGGGFSGGGSSFHGGGGSSGGGGASRHF